MATAQTIIRINPFDGFVQVTTQYGDDKPRLNYSSPTGNQAAYPEAIEANRLACIRDVDEFVADHRKFYPGAVIVDNR